MYRVFTVFFSERNQFIFFFLIWSRVLHGASVLHVILLASAKSQFCFGTVSNPPDAKTRRNQGEFLTMVAPARTMVKLPQQSISSMLFVPLLLVSFYAVWGDQFQPPDANNRRNQGEFLPDNGAEDVLKIRQQQSMISSAMLSFSSTMQRKEEMRLRSQTAKEKEGRRRFDLSVRLSRTVSLYISILRRLSAFSTLMLSKGEVLSTTNNNDGGNKIKLTIWRNNSEFG